MVRVTRGARGPARAAGGATARRAAAGAVVAERRVTPLATRSLLVADQSAAVTAGDADPLRQRDVGALGVVRRQRLRDDREEVEQAAVAKRRTDRRVPLAFAKLLVPDMGMDDAVVVSRRGGGDGADDVREGGGGATIPGEFDFKRSQFDPFQDDRISDDRQQRFLQTHSHFRKLWRKREEIVDDLPQRRDAARRRRRQLVEFSAQLADGPPESLLAATPGVTPRAIVRLDEEALERFDAPPRTVRQLGRRRRVAAKRGRDAAGGANQIAP